MTCVATRRLGVSLLAAVLVALPACRGGGETVEGPDRGRRAVEARPPVAGGGERVEAPEGRDPEGRESARLGEALVKLEVAAVPEARARGLSGRASLERDCGMIFIYPEAARRRFWMKGCIMALDVAYLDDERRIFQIGSLDPPEPGAAEYPALSSTRPARFVIEMEKGWFESAGVRVGDRAVFSESLESWVDLVSEEEGRR